MSTATVAARPLAARVSPVEGLRHTATLAWRTLVQIKHDPAELIDFSVQPLMFVILFTYVFGGALSGSPHAYLTFALSGIIVQNAFIATMNTGVALNNDLQKGVFDRLRSLPIARFAPLAGRICADIFKQLWAFALLIGVGYALGFRVTTNPLAVLGAAGLLVAVSVAVSWTCVLIGLLASTPEKVQIFGFTVIFPLTFTSSAFVPIRTMPGWLQAWAKADPVTLLSDAMRGLLVGGPVARPALYALAYAVGLTLVFAPLAVAAFKRRV